VTLPKPGDINLEDRSGATIISAKSLDGKTQLTLNGNILTIRALPKYLGTYQVELEFGSSAGGIDKTTFQGTIIEDPRMKVNPFIQPNDSTLNWYGSGDATNDNVVNGLDLNRIIEIINGTYTNPSDIRLLDRADVNGDGIVNISDKDLLEKKLNGVISYLPGYWNLLVTREERLDWLRKMIAIDHTEMLHADKTANCVQFSNQLMINFRGFSNDDLAKFLSVHTYDVTTNGRFNIPMCEVLIGADVGAHMMNTVVVGDDAFVWTDLCTIEPQYDELNCQPGQRYFYGANSEYDIRGPPIKLSVGIIDMATYCGYAIKSNLPSLSPWRNPDLLFINSRSKK
jgi:hypothetical protein